VQALRDITLYVKFSLEDSIGGSNAFLLQKCPTAFLTYLLTCLSKFQSDVFTEIRRSVGDEELKKLKS
jgi:hypothetical protein